MKQTTFRDKIEGILNNHINMWGGEPDRHVKEMKDQIIEAFVELVYECDPNKITFKEVAPHVLDGGVNIYNAQVSKYKQNLLNSLKNESTN